MVIITYKVGDTEITKSFDFNYTLSEETFDNAFVKCVDAFNSAQQGASVVTALDKAPVAQHKEVEKTISATPKKSSKTELSELVK